MHRGRAAGRPAADQRAPDAHGARLRHGRRAGPGHQTKARDHSDGGRGRRRAGLRPTLEPVDDDRGGPPPDGDVLITRTDRGNHDMSEWTDIGSASELEASSRLEGDVNGYRVR